jgi:hypothetical protein
MLRWEKIQPVAQPKSTNRLPGISVVPIDHSTMLGDRTTVQERLEEHVAESAYQVVDRALSAGQDASGLVTLQSSPIPEKALSER